MPRLGGYAVRIIYPPLIYIMLYLFAILVKLFLSFFFSSPFASGVVMIPARIISCYHGEGLRSSFKVKFVVIDYIIFSF